MTNMKFITVILLNLKKKQTFGYLTLLVAGMSVDIRPKTKICKQFKSLDMHILFQMLYKIIVV